MLHLNRVCVFSSVEYQEAERGVKFQRFPPVLCLHLLRFEYDFTLSQHRKINDRYSFDVHLDLSEFLEKPDCSPCSYKLLSILVHSGDNSSGHYVSFINPDLDGQVRRKESLSSKSSSLLVDSGSNSMTMLSDEWPRRTPWIETLAETSMRMAIRSTRPPTC